MFLSIQSELFTHSSLLTDNKVCQKKNRELTKGQKIYDKEHMVNDISTRNRLCEAVRGVDASSLQDARLTEMYSDEQAKITNISNVLSSISTNSGKTDDLVHQLLKAYGPSQCWGRDVSYDVSDLLLFHYFSSYPSITIHTAVRFMGQSTSMKEYEKA